MNQVNGVCKRRDLENKIVEHMPFNCSDSKKYENWVLLIGVTLMVLLISLYGGIIRLREQTNVLIIPLWC